MNRTYRNHHHQPVETNLTIFSGLPVDESLLGCFCFDNLLSEIKLNIFSRLPVESVLDCRLVCKPWANLLTLQNMNPYFAYIHLQHDSDIKSFVVFVKNGGMFYVDDSTVPNCLTIRRISFRPEYSVHGIIGSCNGLICLSHEQKCRNYYYNESKPIYICNPVTSEHVTLPGNWINSNITKWKPCNVLGFGFQPITKEYKVVRISYPCNLKTHTQLREHPQPAEGRIEVYTLGSRTGWRSIGETKFNLLNYADQASICVNGSLYWISKESGKAILFDLADEEFRTAETQINGVFRFLGVSKSGEVLFQHRESGSLCAYNPKTETTIPIKLCDWNYVIANEEMIWHVNSFVSLRALGEANVKMSKG